MTTQNHLDFAQMLTRQHERPPIRPNRRTVTRMDEQPPRVVPPGWYPDPEMADTRRYWDGSKWGDNVAPAQSASSATSRQVVIALVVAASIGGGILSQQTVSLMTGSGIIWAGVALAVGAAIVSVVVPAMPTWTQVVCILVAAGAVYSGIAVEAQLSDTRDEISNLIDE